jgi:hypothetical protein
MPLGGTPSVQRGRPHWGQGLRAARAAEELPQPLKTANVEILGGHLAGASHGPDELSAAIHCPQWGVVLRGIGLQSLKLKRLALPGDGSLMVAHWPGPEEGGSCRKGPFIVRCSTRADKGREWAGRGAGGLPSSARDVRGHIGLILTQRWPPSRGAARRWQPNRAAAPQDLDPLAA